jgi:endonuclease YncB( thermonuclease family)
MFHLLHRLVVGMAWVLAGAAGLYVYQQRAVFYPAVDFVTAWRIQEGFHQETAGEIRGRVVRVASGDTFQLTDDTGRAYQVRLTGLAAPEFHPSNKALQALAGASRTNLSRLILSNDVRVVLTYSNAPRSGLGIVYLGETNVNAAQIASGQAEARHEYMNGLPLKDRYLLLRAERFAAGQKSDPNP